MSHSVIQPLCGFQVSPSFYLSNSSQPIFYIFTLCPFLILSVILFFCPLIYWLLLWFSWAQGSICSPHAKDVLTVLRRLTEGLSQRETASGENKHSQRSNTSIICKRKCDVYCEPTDTHALSGMSQEVANSFPH